MTRIYGEPSAFASEALAGFCDLYSEFVRPVEGGVVRSTGTPDGKVAVVIGGGSGHYPAFAGYVGPGFADGAVVGEVFASPSTKRIVNVAKLASRGGGVVLGFGNYAGDVLNFGAAAKQLTAEGVPAYPIIVTDDIASGSADEHAKRRGIAGDVVVFKLAGAAAEAGYELDDVVRVAEEGNRRTRTLGVAFAGVTLPGKTEPLFTVEPGSMGVGLGIHGEAGVSTEPVLDAAGLSALLVDKVVADAPTGAGSRVAVLLNGLGSTKYEELFVLWSYIGTELRSRGLELVTPLAGEFVTSLDMAGCSLTVCWLDDELETLWTAPGACPALRVGSVSPAASADTGLRTAESADQGVPDATEDSRSAAAQVSQVLEHIARLLSDSEAELGRIDSIAGDGDHGSGMARGSRAAADAARVAFDQGGGASYVLCSAADSWAEYAGGTSGALWGMGLRAAAGQFSDRESISMAQVVAAARAALDAVVEAGGAQPGDKTLVDALYPLVHSLESDTDGSGDGRARWAAAAQAATDAAQATAELTPRLGRARPLAERSIGHPDAGAISLAMCATAAGAVLR